jgi:hypothetical protein
MLVNQHPASGGVVPGNAPHKPSRESIVRDQQSLRRGRPLKFGEWKIEADALFTAVRSLEASGDVCWFSSPSTRPGTNMKSLVLPVLASALSCTLWLNWASM